MRVVRQTCRAKPQQTMVEEMKHLSKVSSQLQCERLELKEHLSRVELSRTETEHFIRDFEGTIYSQAKDIPTVHTAISIKLKARLGSLTRECDQLRRSIRKVREQRFSKFGENQAMIEESDSLLSLIGFRLPVSDTDKTFANLSVKKALLEEQLIMLRIKKEGHESELRHLQAGLRSNRKLTIMEEAKVAVQTPKVEESQFEDRENSEQIKALYEQKWNALVQVKGRVQAMKKSLELTLTEQEAVVQKRVGLLAALAKYKERITGRLKQRQEDQQEELVLTGKNLLQQEKKKARIERAVTLAEVAPLGEIISMAGSLKKMSSGEMAHELTRGCVRLASIGVMADNLTRPPFELSQESALLLARFAVEDSKQHKVEFDHRLSTPVEVARCVFQKLVGKVRIFTGEQLKQRWQAARPDLVKFGYLINPVLGQRGKSSILRKQYYSLLLGSVPDISREDCEALGLVLYGLGRDPDHFETKLALAMAEESFWDTHCRDVLL